MTDRCLGGLREQGLGRAQQRLVETPRAGTRRAGRPPQSEGPLSHLHDRVIEPGAASQEEGDPDYPFIPSLICHAMVNNRVRAMEERAIPSLSHPW